ncbi:uncharacterized protein EI97DRAFT_502528 [Westerdykella ornata]|uniref:MARVEL domain-containing protein n=1 Tax=Westerdykella ornata TaxID=318751 RepID=A0A6A6JDQ7_WESOR|nr:uncharacterized protein EI97DRAFT_502528 [Westerdykella ornata]KAF2274691.1 hypothetical protein EI97DRAFT_502528 [Westerdykella ornata]
MGIGVKAPVVWKKRILIPFWILRICIMVFIIAAYSWAIKVLKDQGDGRKGLPRTHSIVLFMLMTVIVLLLDILAILLFLRDRLTPNTFLVMTSAQTGFWVGVLIMETVAVANGASALGLIFVLFCLLSFVGLLIYAIVKYRKAKREGKRGQYALAYNPSGAPITPTAGHHPPAFMNAAPYREETTYNQTTAYKPQGAEFASQVEPPAYYYQAPAKPTQMV